MRRFDLEAVDGDETGIAEAIELEASEAWDEDEPVAAAPESPAPEDEPVAIAPEKAASEEAASEDVTEAESLPESVDPEISASETAPEADAAPEADERELTAEEAEAVCGARAALDTLEAVETSAFNDDLDWSEPEAEPEPPAEQAQDGEAASEPDAKPTRARVIKVRRADALMEPTAPTTDEAQNDEDTLAAIGAALAEPVVANDSSARLSPEEEAELALELAELEAEIGPIAETPDDLDDLDEAIEKAAKADQTRLASEIEDAEIVEPESPPASAPPTAARLDRAATEEPAEANLSRLLTETNTKLDGVENRRRFSAIAHLKAAVAATVADRALRGPSEPSAAEVDEAREIKRYRDDLTKAVRPRRPGAAPHEAATRRPSLPQQRLAPLVLVSEQRIDRPRDAAVGEPHVIRPRRVAASQTSSAALAARHDYEDEAEDYDMSPLSPSEAHGFAEFARKLGARELPELLEAAAAYTADVEGQPHFTRPHLIRKVAALSEQPSGFDREAGLRSFGTLLREGKIAKVKRGQFAITEVSRYYPAQRRAR